MDLDTDTVLSFYKDYLRHVKMDWLFKIYNDLKKEFPMFFYLYKRIKKEGLDKQDITGLVRTQQLLKEMDRRVDLYSKFIRGQQLQKQQLEQQINDLQSKIQELQY